jgi:HPt (histidine-containing phosphotransfer) domain-containing protein
MNIIMNHSNGHGILDLAEVLERMEGDTEFLTEIVNLFLEDCPKLMVDIEMAVRRGDSPELARAAHSLKGSVSNFAAKDAHEAALRLEMIGRQGDLARAEEALMSLAGEIERLKPALTALVQEYVA